MSGGLSVGLQDFLRELASSPSPDCSLIKEGRASLIKEGKDLAQRFWEMPVWDRPYKRHSATSTVGRIPTFP